MENAERGVTEIITDEERSLIIDYIDNGDKNEWIFNPNNRAYFLYFSTYSRSNKVIELLQNIRKRIILKEGFSENYTEPSELPDFLTVMPVNTKLHNHKDGNDRDFIHIRFNVLVRKTKGGVSIYGGKRMNCNEKCYIMCRSGLDYHSSGTIKGTKSKISISYGFNIPLEYIDKYHNIFKYPYNRKYLKLAKGMYTI